MSAHETSVLIVEPDLDIQSVYRQKLIHDPNIDLIGICSSMGSAMALLSRIDCNVLFTELNLPDGNGADLISSALNDHGVENCVVITNRHSQSDIDLSIENGATGYILKGEPGSTEIGSFVRLVTSGGSPISPSIARMVIQALKQRREAESYKRLSKSNLEKNPLSRREGEILQLLAKGMSFAEISNVLQISTHTVTAHIKKIYRKLQVHSRGEAVYAAIQLGLLDDSSPETTKPT